MTEATNRPIIGRPSTYSDEIAGAICQALMAGKSLRQVCDDEGMPARSTVYIWLDQHEDFAKRYETARRIQFDTWADEIVDIADTVEIGTVIKQGPKGEEIRTGDMTEHRRLRVDSRKWILSKLDRGRFGDRVTNEHTGADGAPLIPVINVTVGGVSAK